MLINSTRFGQVEVSDKEIIQFSLGMPGFPEEKAFALLPYKEDSPFYFLQSLADADLAFLAVNPFDFFPDYEFTVDDALTDMLGFSQEARPEVYTIVTVPEKIEDMTANLLAPVVINRTKQAGAQLILEKSAYTTRHRLLAAAENKTEGGK